MRTTVEPLEGNRVKLSVELDEAEFERDVEAAFRRIAREVRIPGFRPGKAPRRLLEARLGKDVGRQEALREALPNYYAQAVDETDVDVIAPPEIDITTGQEDGPVAFDAVVEVRPRVEVPGYASLRVTVPTPEVTEEDVDGQIERLRQNQAELASVDRAARDGDQVSIDIAGSVEGEPVEGLTADDYLYPLGSGSVVAELDEHLRGAKVGDILVFDAPNPEDPDITISFRVLVKDVKEQVLPDVDDEWANEASEFDTVEELRDDLRTRLESMKRMQSAFALRQRTEDALVLLIADEPPEALVSAEMERRVRDLAARLQQQGMDLEQYLAATGQGGDELAAQLREPAVAAVKADLGLRAVIEAESIDATDDEVDAELAKMAERLGEPLKTVRRSFERADGLQALRSNIKKSNALEWLVEHAEVVDEEGRPVDRALLEPLEPDAPNHDDAPVDDAELPSDPPTPEFATDELSADVEEQVT
ncbi:MAG: trigger factor [Acidimicrobiia bacterium]|nr:trigger factor [Acidimicrobiia bacterium]